MTWQELKKCVDDYLASTGQDENVEVEYIDIGRAASVDRLDIRVDQRGLAVYY